MKKLLFYCLVTLFSRTLFGQDKAMLTKEETVNYINKKIKEAVSLPCGECYSGAVYTQNNISLSDSKIEIAKEISYSPGDCGRSYHRISTEVLKFNPVHITDIKDGPSSKGAVGYLIVSVIPQTSAVNSYDGHCSPKPTNFTYWEETRKNSQPTELFIYYLKSDPANFSKLKKAFEHLKSLSKAEDDPFGE